MVLCLKTPLTHVFIEYQLYPLTFSCPFFMFSFNFNKYCYGWSLWDKYQTL